jgi:hypothetical protein
VKSEPWGTLALSPCRAWGTYPRAEEINVARKVGGGLEVVAHAILLDIFPSLCNVLLGTF